MATLATQRDRADLQRRLYGVYPDNPEAAEEQIIQQMKYYGDIEGVNEFMESKSKGVEYEKKQQEVGTNHIEMLGKTADVLSGMYETILKKPVEEGGGPEAAQAYMDEIYPAQRDMARKAGLGKFMEDKYNHENAKAFAAQWRTSKKGKLEGVRKYHAKDYAEGGFVFDDATGQLVRAVDPGTGKPLTPIPADVELAGRKRVAGVETAKEASETGKYYGEAFTKTQEGEQAARTKLDKLDRLESYYQEIGTGKLKPTTAKLASYAQGLGIQVDPTLGEAQAAQSLAREMALQLRNPSGGAGMPGAMSDADRAFLESMVPGLANDPRANKLIIDTMKKVERRNIEVARKAREYRRKHGRIDEGFTDMISYWADKNPLFGKSRNTAPAAPQVAPAGTKAKLKDGRVVTSDGKGGWR